jgi:hypothetical protein
MDTSTIVELHPRHVWVTSIPLDFVQRKSAECQMTVVQLSLTFRRRFDACTYILCNICRSRTTSDNVRFGRACSGCSRRICYRKGREARDMKQLARRQFGLFWSESQLNPPYFRTELTQRQYRIYSSTRVVQLVR